MREVVLAPGSRNAPLAFAAYDAAEAGLLRLHTRIDERTAGFLALGLTKGGSRAAVVCTSGTAVANLHPAVLEAHHAGLPLVAVTADRPLRLRGTDANQTTDQVGIFGPLVATARRRPSRSTRSGPGWCTSTSSSTTRWCRRTGGRRTSVLERSQRDRLETRGADPSRSTLGPRTVVVAGDDAGPRARALAARGRLAAARRAVQRRPHRRRRCGPTGCCSATELADQVERVRGLRPPDAVAPGAAAAGPRRRRGRSTPTRPGRAALRRSTRSSTAAPSTGPTTPPGWPRGRRPTRSVSRQLDALLDEAGFTAYHVAGAVSRALPPGGHLVVGASNPIRDLDLMATAYDVGSRRKVIANRGLSGIDGTVSTAIGASLARKPTGSSRNLALMGDVTFLHDRTAW